MIHRYDFLIIGTGIAGLSYALKAARVGSVAIITKKEKAESNTNYAQGGVAAVMSAVDSFDLHMKDTLATGMGLSHRDAVEVMVREGPERLRELIDVGVRFTHKGGALDLGREGGHSTNRIVHSNDLTGREIERALLQAVSDLVEALELTMSPSSSSRSITPRRNGSSTGGTSIAGGRTPWIPPGGEWRRSRRTS